jgi:hypothetical protein
MATLSDLTLILEPEVVLTVGVTGGFTKNTDAYVRSGVPAMQANGIADVLGTARKGTPRLNRASGIDTAVGDEAPSLKLRGYHKFSFPALLPVEAGARSITVDVLQPVAAAARCQLIVKASRKIGLLEDMVVTAGAGTGWQTLTASFTATANGAVRIVLLNPGSGRDAWFDNVAIV